jgi:tetratricopeptide (TPR) repeat protein
LWIDPTSTFTPFGELPAEDQGRLALVASDTTGELVRTPRTTSSENGVTAQQVMTISESSPAKIATVTTYRGAFAPPVRESFASANQKQQRDYLRQQGLVRYGTDKLVDFSCTRPDDLKSPFQVKADYDETPLVTVAHPQALAIVPLYEPVDWMPFDLTGPADSSQVASPEEGTGSKDQRDLPLVLPFAVRYESEYRVVPPVGYVPVNVPPGQTVELGPARLEVTLRAEDDHSVTVRVLFDGGDAGFSAAAVRESRHKIEALGGGRGYQAWQTAINFEHTAGKHLEAGRLREAVVGYHALLQQYPEESIRHIQFAHAVLRLGLGDLARQHARRAVELAPAEFHAWYTLGLVLSHDRIGQQMAPGFDRAGAEAAYRKALEIEPDDATTRWDLGTLLEYDEQGHLFGNPTFTDAAIVELTAAYEQRKYEDLLDGLVSAMYIQGRKAEARKLIEQVSPCPTRDLHLLVAVATTEGVDACLQRAAEMQPVGAQRQQLLRQLLVALSYFREYQTVGALAQQLAVNSPQEDTFLRFANEARWFSRYRPEDESTDDPVGLVRRVVADALVYGTASSRLKRYFANVPDSAEFAFDCGVPCWMESFRREPLNSGFSRDRRADSVTEFNFEAVAAGADAYRVLVEHKMFPHLSWTAYVLRGAQGLQLYRAGHRQAEFGRLALELLAAGREDDARRWLNWAYERQRQDVGALARLFDQFAGTPFVRLWTVANKDTRDVQLAAAALAASGESPEQSLAILSANRADLDAHKQLQVDRAVAAGYAETGDYQKLLALAAAIRQRHPKAFEPIAMELRARSRLQDLDAIEKIVGENADVEEVRTLGQVALAEAATAVGNTGKATELLALLARQQDQLPPWLLSHVARLSLFQDPVPEGTLALATGALERTPDAEPEEQAQAERAAHFSYVLALIEAGQLLEAVQALHAIPAIDPDSRPNSFDKLALGWIADKCGLPEHAAKLFGEVQPSKNAQPCAVFDLARKRLQRMANQADEDRDRPPPDGAPGSL